MTSTAKILNELKDAGLIEDWTRVRERRDDITETYFKVRSEHVSVSHEIYGRKAEMYFTCKSPATISPVKAAIHRAGGKTGNAWMGSSRPDCFTTRVSYFKGPRWWE